MTKQDFIQRKERADKNSKLFAAIYLPGFFLLLIANIGVARIVPKQYSGVYLILFFGLLIANVVGTLRIESRRADKFGLRCPNCKKPLTRTLGQVAIATGNCGNCGTHLFSN